MPKNWNKSGNEIENVEEKGVNDYAKGETINDFN